MAGGGKALGKLQEAGEEVFTRPSRSERHLLLLRSGLREGLRGPLLLSYSPNLFTLLTLRGPLAGPGYCAGR